MRFGPVLKQNSLWVLTSYSQLNYGMNYPSLYVKWDRKLSSAI